MRSFWITLGMLLAVPVLLQARDTEGYRLFETSIRPLLVERCYQCHGPEKSKGGLRLDHRTRILAGGDSGPALVEGDPDGSLLMEAVWRSNPELEMPPKEPLAEAEVAALEKWIQLGAPWPSSPEEEQAQAVDEHGFSQEDYDWWAVKAVVDPPVPARGANWARNEIDRFVAERLYQEGLEPAPRGSAEELVRRAYFDLHGLPPTLSQVEAFVDASKRDFDAAWSALVEELLSSPRYGERWAQHWLDVVRYAESDGYRADDYRPGVWKYRDYVIKAFNGDKPYDDFIREQLAGDELAAHDPETLIATAFLRHGIYEWNQRNARMHWELIINEMTNVTGEVFLGLGIGCAQCHDHKFDPILQKDYYALQSFLATVWWPETHPLVTPEEKRSFEERNQVWESATAEIRSAMDALLKPSREGKIKYTVSQFPADIQLMYGKPASERTPYEEQMAQLVQRQVDGQLRKLDAKKSLANKPEQLAEWEELEKRLKGFETLKPDPLPMGFISTDVSTVPVTAGYSNRKGRVDVEPAFLTLLGQPAPKIVPTGATTGRRTALANWIADPANPLSTRVMVNRIWQRHFGRGIVATPNDFGTLGEAPSHPELLDWLTTRFLDQGWRMKPVHRLILESETYLQTARREPGQKEQIVDPDNRLLWRFPPRRLAAEELRDAMLAISGELSEKKDGPSSNGSSKDRSVFTKKRRNSHDPVLAGFDAPSNFDSAPERLQTTTPIQALLLINHEWPLARARSLAVRLLRGKKTISESEVTAAYASVWGRPATVDEIRDGLAFVKGQSAHVSEEQEEPEDRFPGETGLRPIAQHFSKVEGIPLGARALWLQPGSRFEQLAVNQPQFVGDAFTVEAVTILDNVHRDAKVNTLVSRWNGDQRKSGWTFGVTSEKSRYQPRNLIVQLIGRNSGGSVQYEVVASDLRVPLRVPVYLAAAITTDAEGRGSVRFWMRDLSDPESTLQTAEVSHSIAEAIQTTSTRLVVGARDRGKIHSWDGQLARLSITSGQAKQGELALLQAGKESKAGILDWSFEGENGETPAPYASWIREAVPPPSTNGIPESVLGTMTDFCHALLNSNEFLYLH